MIKGPKFSRPYDIAIPAPLLKQVERRRQSPTGLWHKVDITARGSEEVYVYPYAKMELGDFFIATIAGRSEKAMRTAFKQAAARYDYELFITPIKDDRGRPALRVCLTIIGVSKFKIASEKHLGRKVKISDGRWKATRKAREKAARSQDKGSWQPARKPVWKDDDAPLPIDQAIAVALQPEVPVDPAEIRRRALAGEL